MLPFLVVNPLCLPKRTALQLAAQVLYMRRPLLEVPTICASPLLSHPASAAQLGRVAAALRAGAGLLGLPPAGQQLQLQRALARSEGDAGEGGQEGLDCRATLATLLIMLGYMLPMALTASWEWRSYRRYAERLAARPGGAARRRGGGAGAGRGQRRAGRLAAALGAAQQAAARSLLAAGALVAALLVFQASAALYSERL